MKSKEENYFRFHTLGLKSLSEKSLAYVRKQIYDKFISIAGQDNSLSILDVGVSGQDHKSSNFFEQFYPFKKSITALGLGEFYELEKIYPGLKYVQGDGRTLPFEDKSFDWVFSHAVIEHVGSTQNQIDFVQELLRVSKTGIFLTSPNRLHPLEFHTGIPLLHYLPKKVHLYLYKILGQSFYSSEENLNLLFPNKFKEIVKEAAFRSNEREKNIFIKKFAYWLCLPSNTIFIVMR